jgi:hypothetical protein
MPGSTWVRLAFSVEGQELRNHGSGYRLSGSNFKTANEGRSELLRSAVLRLSRISNRRARNQRLE